MTTYQRFEQKTTANDTSPDLRRTGTATDLRSPRPHVTRVPSALEVCWPGTAAARAASEADEPMFAFGPCPFCGLAHFMVGPARVV